MIIGITGTLGAGKNTVVDYLKQKGFAHYSVRKYLIEEIRDRNLELNRDTMVKVANELRQTNSSSFIVEQLYERAATRKTDCVIESIRTPGEAKALNSKDKFYLIAVDAEQKMRYERIKHRNSEKDNISFAKFQEQEAEEMTSNDPNHQNLSKCMAMADFTVENSGNYDQLYTQVENILAKINAS
ncbi:AAA family ATPase [Patescibacteria group bacterium]|nr:AAA family ATPase [Patescibacteria group bacterium]